ncbi:MAG: nucleotide exchange factor GrpE [Alphaproteobacteria bacterium]
MTNDESNEGQATEPGGEAAAEQPAPQPGPQPGSEADALRAEFETEITRLKDQLLRALAEVENTRRRAEREREDTAKFAISGFARDVLTVADNLRRALENIPAHTREKDELLNTLAVGVEATGRQLMAAFEQHGIRKIDPMGEAFDHNFHQAMFEVEDTGKPAGTVVQVMQAGYVINGRLLRPALVAVAKGEPAEARVDTTV